MEPLSMLGVASSITNFVELTSKFLERPCKIYGKREDVRLRLRVLYKELSLASTIVEGPNLWIDSLCIDQQDYAERGKQVSQMNQIYWDYSSGRRFEGGREQLAAFRAIVCNRLLQELDRMCVMEESLSQILDADDPNRVLQHLTPKLRTTPHLYIYSRNANRTRSRKPVILDTGRMGEYLVSRGLLGNLRPPMKGSGNMELQLSRDRTHRPRIRGIEPWLLRFDLLAANTTTDELNPQHRLERVDSRFGDPRNQ
jgi:hypothetical protein